MPLIDDRGRLFGRYNLFDVGVVIALAIVLPVVYGAYVLFQVPPPRVTSVEPSALETKPDLRVRIRGENLMPYLTAYVSRTGEPISVFLDDRQNSLARFLIETPETGVLELPSLTPGEYDIYLYSEAEQLVHVEHAFTVTLPPEEAKRLEEPPPPPPRSVARVWVDFVVPRRAASRPKVGDYDRHGSPTLSGEPDAKLLALTQRPAPANVINILDPVVLSAVVRVPVTKTEQGLWWYKGQRIRPGEWLAFGDVDYYLYGMMMDAEVPDEAPWEEQP